MKIFTETERLILREVIEEDEAGFFELDSDPEVHKYLGNNPVKNMEQVREVIQFIRQQYIDNGIGRWAIVEKSTNEFIGWAGLKLVRATVNGHSNFYDLGYRLIKSKWGKGYATEAARASLNYGFKVLNLNKIFAMANVENDGSNHILEKVGFNFAGEFYSEGIKHNWYELEKPTVEK